MVLEKHVISARGRLSDVAVSRDGRLLAVGRTSGAGIILYDAATFEIVSEAKRVQMADSVCFSPDGKYLAFGSGYAVVGLLFSPSMEVHHVTRVPDCEAIFAIDVSPASERLVSGHGSGAVIIWKVPELTVLYTNKHNISKVFAVKFLSEDRVVSGNSSNTVRVWDVDKGLNVIVGGHAQEVQCVAVSHDGSLFASGGYDATIAVYNAETFDRVSSFLCVPGGNDDDGDGTMAIAFYDNDTIIVSLLKTITTAYNIHTGLPVKTLGCEIVRPRGVAVVGREGE